jgi:hypothetical protein
MKEKEESRPKACPVCFGCCCCCWTFSLPVSHNKQKGVCVSLIPVPSLSRCTHTRHATEFTILSKKKEEEE